MTKKVDLSFWIVHVIQCITQNSTQKHKHLLFIYLTNRKYHRWKVLTCSIALEFFFVCFFFCNKKIQKEKSIHHELCRIFLVTNWTYRLFVLMLWKLHSLLQHPEHLWRLNCMNFFWLTLQSNLFHPTHLTFALWVPGRGFNSVSLSRSMSPLWHLFCLVRERSTRRPSAASPCMRSRGVSRCVARSVHGARCMLDSVVVRRCHDDDLCNLWN